MIGTIALAAITSACGANGVTVEIEGVVRENRIGAGELSAVQPGETAVISFAIDPDDDLESLNTPTRGYSIDRESFRLSFSGGTSVPLASRAGRLAYFVLRDDDPAADGFFLSAGTELATPLPLEPEGEFGNLGVHFNVSYRGDTLTSLDVLDAGGTYGQAGLEVFGMGVSDAPIEAVLGIDFVSMTIAVPGGADSH